MGLGPLFGFDGVARASRTRINRRPARGVHRERKAARSKTQARRSAFSDGKDCQAVRQGCAEVRQGQSKFKHPARASVGFASMQKNGSRTAARCRRPAFRLHLAEKLPHVDCGRGET